MEWKMRKKPIAFLPFNYVGICSNSILTILLKAKVFSKQICKKLAESL